MALEVNQINIGFEADDGTGEAIRSAFSKINQNFSNTQTIVNTINSTYANTIYAEFANVAIGNIVSDVFMEGVTLYIDGSPVSTGAVSFAGGNVPLITTFSNAALSTNATTGAIVVTGGAGVGGNINVGGKLFVLDASSNSIDTAGGIDIGQNATVAGTLNVTGTSTLAAVNASGQVNITNTTNSVNTSTGALTIAGGLGVAQDMSVGGNISVSANLNISGTINATNTNFSFASFSASDNLIDIHKPTSGDLTSDNGADVGLKLHYYKPGYGASIAGLVWANDTGFLEYYARGTESGGVFSSTVYGTAKLGDVLSVNTTVSSSTTTGAIRTSGGLGVAGNTFIGGNLVVANTNVSTSTSTGAFIVQGGVGISGAINTGSTLTVAGNTRVNNTFYSHGVYDNSVRVVSTSSGSGNLRITSNGWISLNETGGAGSYGSSTSVPVFTTDAYGRVISVTNTAINFPAAAASDYSQTANVAIFANSISYTTGTFYPIFSNIAGGNTRIGINSGLSYSATSGNLVATAFVGTHWGAVAATSANVSGVTTLIGNLVASATTNSVNTTTGAVVVSGGVGIGGRTIIGGNTVIANTTASTNSTTGALVVQGGVGVAGNINITGSVGNAIVTSANIAAANMNVTGGFYLNGSPFTSGTTFTGGSINDALTITNTTESVDAASGALIVNGGVGIAKRLNVSGNIVANATTTSSNIATGALVVRGGVGVAGNTFIGGNLVVSNTNPSTSTSTGALVVAGGLGVAGAIYATAIYVNGSPVSTSGAASFTAIDNTPIGPSTPNTGAFTTLSATSGITGTLNTASQTNITSVGTLTSLNVSGVTTSAGNLVAAATTSSVSTTTGALVVRGGAGIVGEIIVGGNIVASATTKSTSSTTGALVVRGGVGVAGNINITGSEGTAINTTANINASNLNVTGGFYVNGSLLTGGGATTSPGGSSGQVQFNASGNFGGAASLIYDNSTGNVVAAATTLSSSVTTGALVVRGGLGIAGNIQVGGIVTVSNTTTSSNTTTGGLVVFGDVGISGNINSENNFANLYVSNRFIKSAYQIVAPVNMAYSGNGLIGSSLGTVTSGTAPVDIAVDPSARFIYVTNNTAATISTFFINQDSGSLTSIYNKTAGSGTNGIIVEPTGRFAYVSCYNSNTIEQFNIDQTSGNLTNITTSVSLNKPSRLAVDPAGRFMFVCDTVGQLVYTFNINQTTGVITSVGTAVATGTNPSVIAVDPTGRFVYVANTSSNTISQYRVNQTNGQLTVIAAAIASGGSPYGIVIDLSGRFVYVTNSSSNTISQYSINQYTGALTSLGTVATGTGPRGLAIDPLGKFIYVNNSTVNTLSQYRINQSTGVLINLGVTMTTGTTPTPVVVDPTGRYLYVGNNGQNTVNQYVLNNFSAGAANISGAITATTIVTTNGLFWSNGASATYGNTQVAAYLPIHSGNIRAGNLFVNNTATVGSSTSVIQTGGNVIIRAVGNANSYIENVIYNTANTASASADIIAQPNNGTDTSGWIDLGITSNAFSDSTFGITSRNEGYIFMSAPANSITSGNLILATDSTGLHNALEVYLGKFNRNKGTANLVVSNIGLSVSDNIASRKSLTLGNLITGGSTANVISIAGNVQIDVTSTSYGISTRIGVQPTLASLSALYHYAAFQGQVGVGTTVTNQYGYYAAPTLANATNNYGFFAELNESDNNFNIYATSAAKNYFGGNVGIRKQPTVALDVSGNIAASYVLSNFRGPLEGTVGASIPNTGRFTTVTASSVVVSEGNLVAASTTQSTSSTTGALVVRGGVGVAGNINIAGSEGTAINTTANINASNLNVTGGFYLNGSPFTGGGGGGGGVTSISGTTNQINVNSSTGAVTVSLPSSVTISGGMTADKFTASTANLNSLSAGTVLSQFIGNTTTILTVANITAGNANVNSLSADTVQARFIGNNNSTVRGTIFDGSNRVVHKSTITAANLSIVDGDINLPAHGPTAGSYGSSTAYPIVTVDAYGRVSGVSTQTTVNSISSSDPGNLTVGGTASARTINLPEHGPTAGTYGSSTTYPIVTVDAYGRVSSVSTQTTVNSISSSDPGNLTIGGTASARTINLPAHGPTAGTYGSSTQFPIITVDNFGRVSSVTLQTAVTSIASSDPGNLTIGGTASARTINLPAHGPTAGSYGSSTAYPIVTVDAYGRVSSVSTQTTLNSISSTGGGSLTVGGTADARTINLTSVITAGSVGSASQVPVITFDAYGRITATSTEAVTASSATNISGGSAGAIVYQSAGGTTAFSATTASSGFLLQSGTSGTGQPSWINPSTLAVSSASSATSAGSLSGGSAMSVVYQSSAGATAYLAAGTAGQILSTNSTSSAPSWVSQSSITAGSATNLSAGTAMSVVYQSSAGATAYLAAGTAGQILRTNSTGSAPSWVNQSSIAAGTAVSLSAGTAMSIPYQSAAGTTAYLAAGTAGLVLTTNGTGSAPSWQAVTASTATNIANGSVGQLLVQTGTSTTGFIANPLAAGQILTSNGAGSQPSYSTPGSITVGSANNLTGGGSMQLVYQSAAGTTAYLANAGAGRLLVSNGSGVAPSWLSSSGTDGQVLRSNGSGALPTWQSGSPGFTDIDAYSTSTTWTCPAGVTRAKVTVTGGGGGSSTNAGLGDANSTGGSGGTAIRWYTNLVPGTGYTVTVGAGGGTTGSGGTSSFAGPGGTVSATGGTAGASNNGGDPGIGSGGALNMSGCEGVNAFNPGRAASYWGGGYGAGTNATSGRGGVVLIEF